MLAPILLALVISISGAQAACSSSQWEISVEGVGGIYCVDTQPICIAQISTGSCPTVQDGLPYGSYCGVVASGVYGCKVLDANSILTYPPAMTPTPAPTVTPAPTETPAPSETPAPTPAPTGTPAPTTVSIERCSSGQTEMSVEGVEGIFCVDSQPICIGTTNNGSCPVAQEGLPTGSYCGIVRTGIYGCKIPSTVSPTPSVTPSVTPAPSTETPVPTETPTPAPATETPTPTVTPTPAPTFATGASCSEDQVPMSVEGVAKVFCVNHAACSGDISTGNCPGPQEELEFGSYCGIVRTGVYGCKPLGSDGEPANTQYDPPINCTGNALGDTPVSVANGTQPGFCTRQPVCTADIIGNCPVAQDGLPVASVCQLIPTGVYGCVMRS